ncbi:peptidyl-prolyl cis-trans isomerase CYP21-4-like [Silene latifolia]|uniref:peptidyl-prolyl cis-trans isomerase CYP21-4-like n=1 Tax=Silene latifolia TaxID=37657 RepID=UPI003D76AFAC
MAKIKPQALLLQSKKKKVPSRISPTTIILFSLIVFMVLFFIFSTYRHFSNRSVSQTEQIHMGRKDLSDSKNPAVPSYATLHTSKGLIVVELLKDASPEVVDKFIEFCQKGHFNGMQFYRVIKHYVIQAGEVNSIGAAEEWTLRGKHYDRLDKSVKHEAFMVGTSIAKKDLTGFQLYITTAPISDLNEKINVFGRVVKGEDVVQEIEEVDTDDHYVPKSAIGIMEVTLEQNTT